MHFLLHFTSFHLISFRARSGRSRSFSRANDDATKKKRGVRARTTARIIHARISSIHALMHACMHNHIPSIVRARTSFAIRREEGRVESSRLQKLSRASGDRHARLGDGKKVFNQQYSAISQDFTSTDITPCAKMPRARRPGDVFVPIVCARARVHGYGCVCD